MVEQVELLPVTKEFRRGLAEAIRIIRETRDGFLSEQYAVDQPLSSFQERFACDQCARAIEDEFALGTKEQEALRLATLTPASSGQELREALNLLDTICTWAWRNGFHEPGYDPVRTLRAALNRTPDPVAGQSVEALQDKAAALAMLAVCNNIMATVLASAAPEGIKAPNGPDAKLDRICKKIEAIRANAQRMIDDARATQAGIGEEG